MAIPFVIPSMSFRSRTAAKNYIRDNILKAYELRTRIPAGPHDQLLREVLRLHSDAEEKIGPGIDYFYVQETWRLPGKEAVGVTSALSSLSGPMRPSATGATGM